MYELLVFEKTKLAPDFVAAFTNPGDAIREARSVANALMKTRRVGNALIRAGGESVIRFDADSWS